MSERLRSLTEPTLRALIALGSNLGDSVGTIEAAEKALEALSATPLLRSDLYRTEPVNCPPDSPPFINAVVALTPQEGETPESLWRKLAGLERAFGRKPKLVHNEARPLDLDLVAFGNETRAGAELTLPHPRARGRLFVLVPLSDIAPDLVLPGGTRSVRHLIDSLEGSQGEPQRVPRISG